MHKIIVIFWQLIFYAMIKCILKFGKILPIYYYIGMKRSIYRCFKSEKMSIWSVTDWYNRFLYSQYWLCITMGKHAKLCIFYARNAFPSSHSSICMALEEWEIVNFFVFFTIFCRKEGWKIVQNTSNLFFSKKILTN